MPGDYAISVASSSLSQTYSWRQTNLDDEAFDGGSLAFQGCCQWFKYLVVSPGVTALWEAYLAPWEDVSECGWYWTQGEWWIFIPPSVEVLRGRKDIISGSYKETDPTCFHFSHILPTIFSLFYILPLCPLVLFKLWDSLGMPTFLLLSLYFGYHHLHPFCRQAFTKSQAFPCRSIQVNGCKNTTSRYFLSPCTLNLVPNHASVIMTNSRPWDAYFLGCCIHKLFSLQICGYFLSYDAEENLSLYCTLSWQMQRNGLMYVESFSFGIRAPLDLHHALGIFPLSQATLVSLHRK